MADMSDHATSAPSSLSPVQQSVAMALASGSTISGAAQKFKVSRVTIYHWIKNHRDFSTALQQARAEFVLSRRDDLRHLSDRAFESLLAILDNPRTPAGVLLRTAMFVLQRPQANTGWCMPEPVPEPDREKRFDSVLLEQGLDSLPCLQGPPDGDPRLAGPKPLLLLESTAPALAAAPDFTEPYTISEASAGSSPAYRQSGLSCPAPPAVLEARNSHLRHLEVLDQLKAFEKTADVRTVEDENLLAQAKAREKARANAQAGEAADP
jgi:hypothetical protein